MIEKTMERATGEGMSAQMFTISLIVYRRRIAVARCSCRFASAPLPKGEALTDGYTSDEVIDVKALRLGQTVMPGAGGQARSR